MQLADVLCYIFLTITVIASCVGAEEQKNEIEESQPERRISKREATVIIDNNPIDRIFQKPKVIYRRISKQRYGPPKSKYGPPRPKYRPPKVTRKPGKKAQKGKASSPKYGIPNPNKKRAPKPRVNPPRSNSGRPGFGHLVKMPHYSFFVPDENGFGEPPIDYLYDYQPLKQSYGEPPIDSYGKPIKTNVKETYPTPQSFQETTHIYNAQEYNKKQLQQKINSWKNKKNKNSDLNFAFSKTQPKISIPDSSLYVTQSPIKDNNEETASPESQEKLILHDSDFFFRDPRPQFFTDNAKVVNRPWRPNKEEIDLDDEIIVGGRYAEPPARYVAKFHQNSMAYDDDEIFSQFHGFVDADSPSSATNSPYLNYKNSNMAFSPQNLNDAFSIVDK